MILKRIERLDFTGVIALTLAFLFLFYSVYGYYLVSVSTVVFALFFMILCLTGLILNIKGKTGPSKLILVLTTAFSVLFTYQTYTIGYSVLSLYFPILFSFSFFFHQNSERNYFLASLIFTISCIVLAFLLPRHIFFKIEISEWVRMVSDTLHILSALSFSGILLFLAIRQKNHVNKQILMEKEKVEMTLIQMRETQDKLVQAEKMASIGKMMVGINHEIKNPLHFIKGSYERIKEQLKGHATEDSLSYFDLMDDGLSRIARIVESLTHFSHVTPYSRMECNINDIIENCLTILQFQWNQTIQIERKFCENDMIEGNPGKLHQVFLNILSNAIQAITGKGRIIISTTRHDELLLIQIEDTGKGIPKEEQKQIFDPFFTTKHAGAGTGLGLAISYSIIKEHSGEITFESVPGKGTKFDIKLPLEQLDIDEEVD